MPPVPGQSSAAAAWVRGRGGGSSVGLGGLFEDGGHEALGGGDAGGCAVGVDLGLVGVNDALARGGCWLRSAGGSCLRAAR